MNGAVNKLRGLTVYDQSGGLIAAGTAGNRQGTSGLAVGCSGDCGGLVVCFLNVWSENLDIRLGRDDAPQLKGRGTGTGSIGGDN
jgi:hypothetical protein